MNNSQSEIIKAIASLLQKVGDMPDNEITTKIVIHYIENARITIENAIRLE